MPDELQLIETCDLVYPAVSKAPTLSTFAASRVTRFFDVWREWGRSIELSSMGRRENTASLRNGIPIKTI